jgi:hypothetical protein
MPGTVRMRSEERTNILVLCAERLSRMIRIFLRYADEPTMSTRKDTNSALPRRGLAQIHRL